MVTIGRLRLGGAPRIAVGFADGVRASAITAAFRGGADIAELRIDRFRSRKLRHVLRELRKYSRVPTLATIRSKKEGGQWTGGEAERLELFRAVLPHVGAVDIELSSRRILRDVVRAAKKARRTVIVSYHDFERTPSDAVLRRILRRARAAGADAVKIATMARGPKDVARLARLTHAERRRNVIIIAMGRQGTLSRVLFPVMGSVVTYASRGARAGAPGQLSYQRTHAWIRRLLA